MCAINGITTVDETLVRNMNERTKHRGPDGSSIYVDGEVTLGHNRLAIIDTSHASDQPMKSTDGRYVIVFNGEIYNYRELRNELQHQYAFVTEGDTEVLLAAYMIWGRDMFPRLRGIFAFALWDTQTKELLLARDHMGVKPLYYNIENGILSFSSEMPAILLGMKKRILNTQALSFYLTMEYVPGTETLVEGISKLAPGTGLVFVSGSTTHFSFTTPILDKTVMGESEIYNTIGTAVKRQMVADRPIGAYLSGGFDSSIVVHHMIQNSSLVRTYSVDFEAVEGQEDATEKFNSDALLAQKTGRYFGTEHKALTITLDAVRVHIESIISQMSEPVANSTAITQFLLSEYVRNDGTIVVLGGDGGDELFGGYTRHRALMASYMYQQLPRVIQKIGVLCGVRIQKLQTPFGTPFHRMIMVKDEKKIHPFLLQKMLLNEDVIRFFDTEYAKENCIGEHPLDTFMRVDRRTWLPNECFIRSDYTSMAHGIELRVPFVDTDVVMLSDKISPWKKTLPHQGKRIIRDVYRTHLPAYLYEQPKRGWLSPAAKWFRDPVLYSFIREVFSSGYYDGLDGIFDWNTTRKLLDDHLEKRGYYLYPLWNILVLQIWARKNNIRINLS